VNIQDLTSQMVFPLYTQVYGIIFALTIQSNEHPYGFAKFLNNTN